MRSVRLLAISVGLILGFTSLSHAAPPEKLGPKTIEFKMGSKKIVFSHQRHQQLTKNQCWECHDKKTGKIDNWGESTAHKLCIPCHDLNEKGPVVCKGCHKK